MPEPTDLPDGLRARPMRPGDLAAVAALLAAAEPVDRTGEHLGPDELGDWFVNDRVDLLSDSRVVEDGDGALVGWATVLDPGSYREAYALRLDGRVAVRHRGRGTGRSLLGWQLARARELHRSRRPDLPARFALGVPEAMDGLARLVRRLGFAPVQHWHSMARALDRLPVPRAVDGVALVPWSADLDDEVRRAHNTAFRDHYGTVERDPQGWRTWFTGQRSFRPQVSRLAVSGGVVVGYALVHERGTGAPGEREAHLHVIGVLPPARGRGIAEAAVTAALQAAADDGSDRATLDVDTGNRSGALRLYQKLGFAVVHRVAVHAVEEPPVGAG